MNCLLRFVWGLSCAGLFRVFFWGEIRANPAYWRSPTDSSQHIPTTLFFQENFPQSIQWTRTTWTYLNLNDLTTKICLEEKMVCNLLCFCHSVSSSMRSHLKWFFSNSVFMPVHCDSSICLLGRVFEIILKLRGSCHLRVALKHLQSLCFRFQLP